MARNVTPVPAVPAPARSPDRRLTKVAPPLPVVSIRDVKTHCATCSMRELCLPAGLTVDQMKQVDALISYRTRLKKLQSLYRVGEAFEALFAIRSGSLKTTVLAEDGREQVSGVRMMGEIIGFDGIGTDQHGLGATALEDTEVCALPFGRIEELARRVPALQRNLHQIMSKEIMRHQGAMLSLGSMRGEERLAEFLLDLAERYQRRGYSSTEFVLRVSREEIGSYLGLKLETTSRYFSRFHEEGLIQVQGRSVKLLDPGALKAIAGERLITSLVTRARLPSDRPAA